MLTASLIPRARGTAEAVLVAPDLGDQQQVLNAARCRVDGRPRMIGLDDVTIAYGTGPRAVMDAEKGKPSTGMVVYAALLWVFDLLGHLDQVADPSTDKEGLALEALKGRKRARKSAGLDNEF